VLFNNYTALFVRVLHYVQSLGMPIPRNEPIAPSDTFFSIKIIILLYFIEANQFIIPSVYLKRPACSYHLSSICVLFLLFGCLLRALSSLHTSSYLVGTALCGTSQHSQRDTGLKMGFQRVLEYHWRSQQSVSAVQLVLYSLVC